MTLISHSCLLSWCPLCLECLSFSSPLLPVQTTSILQSFSSHSWCLPYLYHTSSTLISNCSLPITLIMLLNKILLWIYLIFHWHLVPISSKGEAQNLHWVSSHPCTSTSTPISALQKLKQHSVNIWVNDQIKAQKLQAVLHGKRLGEKGSSWGGSWEPRRVNVWHMI